MTESRKAFQAVGRVVVTGPNAGLERIEHALCEELNERYHTGQHELALRRTPHCLILSSSLYEDIVGQNAVVLPEERPALLSEPVSVPCPYCHAKAHVLCLRNYAHPGRRGGETCPECGVGPGMPCIADVIHEERRVAARKPKPVPIRIHCPQCHELHVDEGEWATKPHHTHSCQACGHTWRPAVVNTVGVRFLPGFLNERSTSA